MICPPNSIQTYTGIWFTPLDPKVQDIDIRDIAHALSNMCRYAGHVRKFLSVAEHCVYASYLVDPEDALEALLHDGTEAYLVDVPRPVKYMLPEYILYENALQRAMDQRFSLKPHTKQLKYVDTQLLVTESAQLFYTGIVVEDIPPLANFKIECWNPGYAEAMFLNRFYELAGAANVL